MNDKSEVPPEQPSPGKQQLRGHLRPELTRAPVVGALPDTMRLDLAIGLPLRNSAQLNAFIQAISDPDNAQYRQYLSPAEFTEQFGPTDQAYQAVIAFCEQADGLTVTNTYSNRVVVDVAGSASAIQNAFHMKLNIRRRPDGSEFYAPDREPSLDLDAAVLYITGLDNYIRPRAQAGSAPNGEFGGSDFRNAYAPGVPLTGQGQTVGLFELDGFFTADVNAYKTKFGLSVPVQVVTLSGFSQTPTQSGPNGVPGANAGETTLDIDMAMAMAPGLQSVVVYEGSTQDSVLAAMVSPPAGIPLSRQLSASYTFGITPTTQQHVNTMAAQGQTFFVIAGDGRALCASFGEIGDSRSLVNVTVVGGTNLTMTGAGTAWQAESAGSNGGGVETNITIPSYQNGLATAANGGSNVWRNIPDVALVSGNVFIYTNNGQQANVGGTSIAAPLWAGYMALVNQQAQLAGMKAPGFINPLIYKIGGMPAAYARDFHDIQVGGSTLSPPPCNGYIGYNATVGYDLVSGWGTPKPALIGDLVYPPPQPYIFEWRLQPGTGWIQADLALALTDPPAWPAAGNPFAYVTRDEVPRVIFRGANNHIIEWRLQSTGWIQADLALALTDPPAIAAAGDPFAYVTPDGVPRVIFRGANNHIIEWRLQSTGWIQADLALALTDPPAIAAAGDPFAYVTPDGVPRVIFRGANNHIIEWRLQSTGWIQADLALALTDPPAIAAAGDPFAYVTPDGVPRVIFRGANNHIIEWRLQSTGWIQADLALALTDPPAIAAAGDPFAYVTPDGVPRVIFRGANNHIIEWRLQSTGWIQADLALALTDPPAIAAAGDPFAYVTPDGVPRVIFRGANNHIIEWRLQSTGWIQADLALALTDPPAIAAAGDPFAYVTPDGVPRVVIRQST